MKSPAVAFDDRDDPDGDSGRNQQQGCGIDLGKRRQERREKREGGERASKEPAAAVRPNEHDSGADHCQRDEDAKVGNGNQPYEVVAEPEVRSASKKCLRRRMAATSSKPANQSAPDVTAR